MTTTTERVQADAVDRVVADLRAAREPVYDSTDPIQVAAVERLRSEAAEHLTLPREVFTDPKALVDLLADSAEHHGWTIDRREHTRSTLLHVARTLVQVLIPAKPMHAKDDVQPPQRCPGVGEYGHGLSLTTVHVGCCGGAR